LFWNEFTFNPLLGIVYLSYYLLNAITVTLFWIWIVIVDTNFSTVMISFSTIFFLKMRQVNGLLYKPKMAAGHLRQFMREHTRTLTDVCGGNRFYGYLLGSYLVLVVPVNTAFIIGIWMGAFGLIAGLFNAN